MTANLRATVAILNSKGGVGKTTTAVNLAAALAGPARRVLLIDLDSQASSSMWCGVPRGRLLPSSASCLIEAYPIQHAIRETTTPHLDLLTGSPDLASTDLALCDVTGRESVLKGLLDAVRRMYDIIVLDCPPSLSLICVNALVAADAAIVPVAPHHLAVEGLTSLLGTLEKVQSRLGSRVRLLGVVLTMVEAGAKGPSAEICKQLRRRYRNRVFRTAIGMSPALRKAPAKGQTILTYAPRSSSAAAFRSLAGEVLQRLSSRRH